MTDIFTHPTGTSLPENQQRNVDVPQHPSRFSCAPSPKDLATTPTWDFFGFCSEFIECPPMSATFNLSNDMDQHTAFLGECQMFTRQKVSPAVGRFPGSGGCWMEGYRPSPFWLRCSQRSGIKSELLSPSPIAASDVPKKRASRSAVSALIPCLSCTICEQSFMEVGISNPAILR